MENEEPNLITKIKRIDFRARAYKLSDDGASQQAQARRHAKDAKALGRDASSIQYHQKAILAIRKARENPKISQAVKENYGLWIERHEQEIRRLESLDSPELITKPTVRVVPPIARRVRREDRRRAKLEKRLKKD